MRTMLISEFKAKCIGVLKDVNRTGEAVTITLRGAPIARVEPVGHEGPPRRLGILKGRMRINGDIVHADTTGDWEMGQ